MSTPTVKLSSGYDMPLVGFGLWKVNNDTCADQVYNAIKAGYRLFDGACGKYSDARAPNSRASCSLANLLIPDYGNEVEVGQGVARAIKEGIVTREDLFLVSKLWNSFHDGDRVEPIARKQLADLGIDYFDLYIVHFPVALEYVDPSVRYPPSWQNAEGKIQLSKATIQETWTAMESLVDKKLARSIGVSNFSPQLLMDLLRHARIRPATLQIEHHPYLTQKSLVNYAQEEGIAVTAYSSFVPLSFIELELQNAKDTPKLFEHAAITSIASKHNRTPAQVLLRWATQRNIAVIPKSNDPTRLAQNLQVTDFDLEASELESISSLNQHLRFNDPLNVSLISRPWIQDWKLTGLSSTASALPSSKRLDPPCWSGRIRTTWHICTYLDETRLHDLGGSCVIRNE